MDKNIYAFYIRYKSLKKKEEQLVELFLYCALHNIEVKNAYLFEDTVNVNQIRKGMQDFIKLSENIKFTHFVVSNTHIVDLDYEKFENTKQALEEVCGIKVVVAFEENKVGVTNAN